VGKLLKEVLDHPLVVVTPPENMVQRREAMSLARFFLMVELFRIKFMIANHTPVVACGVHGETWSERSVDADDHGVLSGTAIPREVIALHEVDHLPEPGIRVHHLVSRVLLLGQPLDGFFNSRQSSFVM